MKTTEIMAIVFGAICGGCLASIQIRRIIKRQLPLSGTEVFKAAAKIKIDGFDKKLLVIAGIAFLLFAFFTVRS